MPTVAGLWTSAQELKDKPVTGAAWDAVKNAADKDFSQPVIADNNSDDDVHCLAAAIVFLRTGNNLYRDRVVEALEYNVKRGNPGLDKNGILTWCRNTGAYALAADLVGYRTAALEAWFRKMVDIYRDSGNYNNTIAEIFYRRPNNWGTMAFGTLCAVYAYLGDVEKLRRVRNYLVRMITGPNPGSEYGKDLSWHADAANPRLINPAGTVKQELNIDGIMPDDMRRNGIFSNPPPVPKTSYHWEALQGLVMGARILQRYDPALSIWEAGDRAILRAVTALENRLRKTFNTPGINWAAHGDDSWMLPFIDDVYKTDFSVHASDPSTLWDHGKNTGWPYVVQNEDRFTRPANR